MLTTWKRLTADHVYPQYSSDLKPLSEPLRWSEMGCRLVQVGWIRRDVPGSWRAQRRWYRILRREGSCLPG